MIADLGTIRALFLDLDTVPDDVVQAYLDDAAESLSASAWGQCYPKAQLLWAAHNSALYVAQAQAMASGDTAAPGPIQSTSAEGLSVTFAQPAGRGESQLWWSQTAHGLAYLALQRQCLRQSRLSW